MNIIIMKKLFALFIIISAAGCKESPDKEFDECVGASYYYLDNQSTRSFSVQFSGPDLNDQIAPATVVNPKMRVLIGQDSDFGFIPAPSMTFSSFSLNTTVNGQKVTLYQQNPVKDSLWAKQKENASDPDFGCYSVDY